MIFAIKDDTLIQKADFLIKGQGDGRISKEDMQELIKNNLDSPEKIETILYILTNYNVTSCAKDTFLKDLSLNCSSIYKIRSIIK